MAGGVNGIDWEQPWFAAVADAGARIEATDDAATSLNRLLTKPRPSTVTGRPIVFVPPEDLPQGQAYEAHIHATGRVPTRDNLHDLFNGLGWLTFPRIKARLNAIQASAIARDGVHATRGERRDAATLFDENGLVLACSSDVLAARLRKFDWQALFVANRTEFLVHAEPWVLGHALLEKLVTPYKAATAHALIVPVDGMYFTAPRQRRIEIIDRLVSSWLEAWPMTSADFAPLPVLGIPGWWPENAKAGFYDDTQVFRAGRGSRSAKESNR